MLFLNIGRRNPGQVLLLRGDSAVHLWLLYSCDWISELRQLRLLSSFLQSSPVSSATTSSSTELGLWVVTLAVQLQSKRTTIASPLDPPVPEIILSPILPKQLCPHQVNFVNSTDSGWYFHVYNGNTMEWRSHWLCSSPQTHSSGSSTLFWCVDVNREDALIAPGRIPSPPKHTHTGTVTTASTHTPFHPHMDHGCWFLNRPSNLSPSSLWESIFSLAPNLVGSEQMQDHWQPLGDGFEKWRFWMKTRIFI